MERINQSDNIEEIFQLSNSWEEKGREKAIEQVVRGMLQEVLPIDLIAKVTGLEIEKIEKIRSTL